MHDSAASRDANLSTAMTTTKGSTICYETLLAASRAVRDADTLADMLRVVVVRAREMLSGDSAAVFLFDGIAGGLVSRAFDPPQPGLEGRRLDNVDGSLRGLVGSGEVCRSADVRAGPMGAWFGDEAAAAGLIGAAMTVPLRSHGDTVGVLHVGFDSASDLTDERQAVLTALADDLGMTLGRQIRLEALARETERRSLELLSARESLLDLERRKVAFVSSVSHELRTPLTNIKLYLSLLQRGREEKRERYVAVLVQEADRLNTLVEDLLVLSRLDMARTRGCPEHQPVDLSAVVALVARDHRTRADELGVSVTVAVPDGEPRAVVLGDEPQLAQAVSHLVENAIVYTPSGGRVDIAVARDAQAVSLTLKDTGIGIPESERQGVFDRFFRGRRAKEAGISGTGLGLAIVHETVALHGGRIEIDPAHSPGTRVIVRLPCRERSGGAT